MPNTTATHVLTLVWHSDPGHAWLEVPCSLIRELNVAGVITAYSYISADKETAFLEEDGDAGAVLEALRRKGVPFRIREHDPARGPSPIRKLHRFEA